MTGRWQLPFPGDRWGRIASAGERGDGLRTLGAPWSLPPGPSTRHLELLRLEDGWRGFKAWDLAQPTALTLHFRFNWLQSPNLLRSADGTVATLAMCRLGLVAASDGATGRNRILLRAHTAGRV